MWLYAPSFVSYGWMKVVWLCVGDCDNFWFGVGRCESFLATCEGCVIFMAGFG